MTSPAPVNWVTPVQTISTTTVFGRFFPNDGDSGAFNTPGTAKPTFTQSFPNINFSNLQFPGLFEPPPYVTGTAARRSARSQPIKAGTSPDRSARPQAAMWPGWIHCSTFRRYLPGSST